MIRSQASLRDHGSSSQPPVAPSKMYQMVTDVFRMMLLRQEDIAAIATFYGSRGPKGLTPDTI